MKSTKKTALNNRELWNLKAEDWHTQVGEQGDRNRVFNSDPVLWRLLGEVDGLDVLDAGCGTGYLSRALTRRGAQVVGVDLASEMIEVARREATGQGLVVEHRADSCTTLHTIPDASIDKLVSNYVLMDLPALDDALAAFYRVLRPGGSAVLVFSHPCFPQSDETELQPDGSVTYRWTFSYFEAWELEEPPWRHFTSPFVFYHRSLTEYWRVFTRMGFAVTHLEEPVVSDPPPLGYDPALLPKSRMRPNSIAFRLKKG